jgi:transglutaminase-like putative cysteine protease
MRLKIAHTTTYRYEPPATGVIQILRMTPGSHDGQYVADWQIDVSTDSRLDVHEDAFGNVTHVLTHGALSDLTIHRRRADRDPRHRRRAARHRRAVSSEPVPALHAAD